MTAMMTCEAIGCPHPEYLESYGVDCDKLTDWHAYYLIRHGVEDEMTDGERADMIAEAAEEWNE